MKSWKTPLLSLLLFFLIVPTVTAEDHFRVGVIAPLSGPLAEYGLAAQNGIELARSQHPNQFQHIKFLYEDSQWDAKQSLSAFARLKNSEHASLIFNWGNPTTEAIAPLAERLHMPLIGMSLDPNVARGKKYVIRSTNAAADFSAVLADYLLDRQYHKIGVVIADNTYVQGLFNGLQEALGSKIKLELIDRFNIQDQDFRSTVTKIRAQKYDALGVFLISGQVSSFYQQLAEQSLSLPTFGTDFFESTTEIRLAKGGMNGAVYPHLGVEGKFREEYIRRFENDYQIAYAGNAYDMAVMLGILFNEVRAPSPEDIMSRLRSVKGQNGVGGIFSFQDTVKEGPYYHFPVQLKKILNEKIEVIRGP